MAVNPTDGFLLVDKPAGTTSQDVVTAVRRALGARRAGHTGTLDPFAAGLLLVLTGNATRLARFVPAEPKVYEAEIRFGFETDSDDATGRPTAHAAVPAGSAVAEAMTRLTGSVRQTPPDISAKQIGGRRAYALARQGQTVVLAPVMVEVHAWEVLARGADRWRVRITCGSGTYIRALARDLGRLAHTAAHVGALRRTRIGPFDVADALILAQLRERPRVRPATDALVGFARARLPEADVAMIRHGRAVEATVPGARAALVDDAGTLVAVAERDGATWRPRVVLDGA